MIHIDPRDGTPIYRQIIDQVKTAIATDTVDIPQEDSLGNEIASFLDCVRTRKKPNADVEIGCRTVTVCHLGNIARWLGRRLKWDPEKELFLGSDAANEYISTPIHEPRTD